jgi:hypothetical protein
MAVFFKEVLMTHGLSSAPWVAHVFLLTCIPSFLAWDGHFRRHNMREEMTLDLCEMREASAERHCRRYAHVRRQCAVESGPGWSETNGHSWLLLVRWAFQKNRRVIHSQVVSAQNVPMLETKSLLRLCSWHGNERFWRYRCKRSGLIDTLVWRIL